MMNKNGLITHCLDSLDQPFWYILEHLLPAWPSRGYNVELGQRHFLLFLINKSKIGLLLLSKELLLQLTQEINGISCTPIWYEAKLHIVKINLTAVDGTKYNFSNTWLGLAVLTHNNNVFLEHCLYFWSNLGWMVISSLEVLSISDDLVD